MALCLELLNTRGCAKEGAWEDSRFVDSFSMEEGVFPSSTARSILCPAVIVTFSVGRGTEDTLDAVKIFVSDRSSFQSSVPHSSVAALHALVPSSGSKLPVLFHVLVLLFP